jgi:molecular chaperone HscB
VAKAKRDMLQNIERLIDHQQAFVDAVGQVRALMFIERFADDVDKRLDQIDN